MFKVIDITGLEILGSCKFDGSFLITTNENVRGDVIPDKDNRLMCVKQIFIEGMNGNCTPTNYAIIVPIDKIKKIDVDNPF